MKLPVQERASFSFLSLSLIIVLTLAACGEKHSPEEQVRRFITTGKAAAEERDVIAINNLVSEHYRDDRRRDRRALVGMTTGYFLRNKNINLFTRINDITFPTDDSAKVRLYVAMTGSPVTGAQALIDLRADLVEFDLTLIRESDKWQLLNASWRHASIEDLLVGED